MGLEAQNVELKGGCLAVFAPQDVCNLPAFLIVVPSVPIQRTKHVVRWEEGNRLPFELSYLCIGRGLVLLNTASPQFRKPNTSLCSWIFYEECNGNAFLDIEHVLVLRPPGGDALLLCASM